MELDLKESIQFFSIIFHFWISRFHWLLLLPFYFFFWPCMFPKFDMNGAPMHSASLVVTLDINTRLWKLNKMSLILIYCTLLSLFAYNSCSSLIWSCLHLSSLLSFRPHYFAHFHLISQFVLSDTNYRSDNLTTALNKAFSFPRITVTGETLYKEG